jgi:major type 1 subunit fimbrin (pilin)
MSKILDKTMCCKMPAVWLIATAALLVSQAPCVKAASDPVGINVTGKILDNTCTVDTVNSDLNPVMDPVSARDLKGKNTTLAKRDIKLVLKECGKDITNGVIVTAWGESDPSDANGYAFMNASTGTGAAQGVGLQFYKQADKETPFKVNGDIKEKITSLKEGDDNTLTFAAAYVATSDEPSAGDFSTTVNLTLEYQ